MFRKSTTSPNRSENAGRWPLRWSRFRLREDYEFPAEDFPEILFLETGQFLHESDSGTQLLHEGSVAVVHPGNRHAVRQPKEVELVRLRFLPEWLAREAHLLLDSPVAMALFLDQSWFHRHRDDDLHILTTREGPRALIAAELECLRGLIDAGRLFEPATRVSLLKLMQLVADEHRHYWRGAVELEFTPPARHAFEVIEKTVKHGDRFRERRIPRGGFEFPEIADAFLGITGLTMGEYAERRRVFEAAWRLIETGEDPAAVASKAGFRSLSACAGQFRRVFGIHPEVYRKKFGVAGSLPAATFS